MKPLIVLTIKNKEYLEYSEDERELLQDVIDDAIFNGLNIRLDVVEEE